MQPESSTARPISEASPSGPAFADPPAHVDAGLIVDFDYLRPEGIDGNDIYAVLKPLHDHPDILWTPRNGGHWIVTRSEDVRWVRERHEIFSHTEFGVPRGAMNVMMPPVTVDPPYHARFRAVLNPAFTPKAARNLEDHARAVAGQLIDELAPRGSCEFVDEFARVMPVIVFLKIMALDAGRRGEFVKWAVGYTSAKEQGAKDSNAEKVAAFLAEQLDARELEPGDDLLSRIVAWRKNPRFESEAEVLGMAVVTFIGGLDTLSNLMSFTARHLADHPEARRRLIEQPELIKPAVEEYIRRHGLTMTGRLIRQDVARKGALMKRDEMLLVIDPLAGIDERAYPDPLTIDFNRANATYDSFGNAEHKCIGEHLARMQIAVFLEEWLKRIPDFAIDPGCPPITYSGPVIGMTQLGLVWDV